MDVDMSVNVDMYVDIERGASLMLVWMLTWVLM